MRQLRALPASLRAFWADPAQRRVLMWVLAAVGALILVYGVVQIVRAQLDYMDRSDKLDAAEQQAEALEQSLGLTNRGDTTPTLTPTAEATASAETSSSAETTPLAGPTPVATPAPEAAANSPTGPELSQSDALLLMTLRSQVRKAESAQIAAYNRRADGIRVIGIGVIVLALAYLVAPTGQRGEVKAPPGPGTQS